MRDWWVTNLHEPGKVPLLVLLVSFVVTFVVVRLLTRLIRAGKGPFGNVSAGGMHIHHVVPGIVLLFLGAVLAVADVDLGASGLVAAVLVGVGGALVFDEFALVVHLDDVYWSEEGRKSVEAVTLLGALLLALFLGLAPYGVDDVDDGELQLRVASMLHLAVGAVLGWVCILKGKYRTAVWALFLVPIGIVGAVRLARPGSVWARRLYGPERHARAVERLAANEARWGRLRRRVQDLVAGSPPATTDTPEGATAIPTADAAALEEPPDRVPG